MQEPAEGEMEQMARRWLSVFATAACAACSGGGTTVEKDVGPEAGEIRAGDVIIGTDLWVEPEAGFEIPDLSAEQTQAWTWCTQEGGFGCACESDSDCDSNWCVEWSQGQVCTISCVEECPPGWTCEMVQGMPDMIWVCLPLHANLCRPCNQDADCGIEGVGGKSFCLDFGPDGKFCGGSCETGKFECPASYDCMEAVLESGGTTMQCLPEDGTCDCTPKYAALGAKTQCHAANEWGKCFGFRYCTDEGLSPCDAQVPKQEECNLEDDNCNGIADDGVEPRVCESQNEFGVCTGDEICVDGDWVCEAPQATQEICDGLDNNCDGLVDEGSLDADGDGVSNCVDDDDDNDGIPDDQDNCPLEPNLEQADADMDLIGDPCDPDDDNDLSPDEEDCKPNDKDAYPGAVEQCDGKDNDCDNLVDEGELDTDLDGLSDCVDDDDDNDGLPDFADNCSKIPNTVQKDSDLDGQGDVCDDDDDNDGVSDLADTCPFVKNPDQKNADGDGQGDACDDDDDNDTIPDWEDNCPTVPNPGQEKSDTDPMGDACDEDDDNDGVLDASDNCPNTFNADQKDTDGDGWGDACTNDKDGDQVLDDVDNCPLVNNPAQADMDGDLTGDACDEDIDGDGLQNELDNCKYHVNPLQTDTDFDGQGDACDPDMDGDAVANEVDNCPLVQNQDQADTDGDGLGNACDSDDDGDEIADGADNCPLHANPGQENADLDLAGDACDFDDDNDGIVDALDNCPGLINPAQDDFDGDGQGDLCDPDDDNDGAADKQDNCPFVSNAGQEDADGDAAGNACDQDDDGDGIQDTVDNCPLFKNTLQVDTDGDGEGDVCDFDDDNDGVPDADDSCPLLANGDQTDTDGDGQGDACDFDDDNDGKKDELDNCPLISNPGQFNQDGDAWGDPCDTDDDNDGVPDAADNCPTLANPGQANHDDDGQGDACDDDDDGDAVPDGDDNCPLVANPEQVDWDGDGKGDACESDLDNDGIPNVKDNCPAKANPDQTDTDKDGQGDACDSDDDGDNTPDATDNCPLTANPDQLNSDGDPWGDACDGDDDNDGKLDAADNCPTVPNLDQADLDQDKKGDACDDDRDGDAAPNVVDNCPDLWNGTQADVDWDGLGDACDSDDDGDAIPDPTDNCPKAFNPTQLDTDKDGLGDVCDDEDDGDGIVDAQDNCPTVFNLDQANTDGDAQGDKCDDDDDGDGKVDIVDNCPLTANPTQKDNDDDAAGDACDDDDDNDGVADPADNCPMADNPNQKDNDKDKAGDACDDDDDNDGVPDAADNCPLVANQEQTNNDNDSLGNACDQDDDGDGWLDIMDNCPTTANPDQADSDNDGKGNACENDADADGDPDQTDCAPLNNAIHHGALEKCDGIDNNCTGGADEVNASGCKTYWYDYDQDGYGKTTDKKCLCEPTGKYTAVLDGDCVDTNNQINPKGIETCDTQDNDCDGETDEQDALTCKNYFPDKDQDGYGSSADKKCLCAAQGAWSSTLGGDCNDDNELINPGQTEKCNDTDDDCDFQKDEEGAAGCKPYYQDTDSDGYGVDGKFKCLCLPAAPYSAQLKGDCDDLQMLVFPGAVEKCDGIDNDCDAQTDEQNSEGCTTLYRDFDDDGYGLANDGKCLCQPLGDYTAFKSGDCNDTDPNVGPAGKEKCNDLDDDCDGNVDEPGAWGCAQYYEDKDADGYGNPLKSQCLCLPTAPYTAKTGGDCDDGKVPVHPGAVEACDGVDTDCNGVPDDENAQGCQPYYKDEDGDGYGQMNKFQCLCGPEGIYSTLVAGDCADYKNSVHPGAAELCNVVDDDCDGQVDEGSPANCTPYYRDKDSDGYGDANDAKCLCQATGEYKTAAGGDCNNQNPAIYPGATEFCNGMDDDCDGQVDEESAVGCTLYLKDADSDGYGSNADAKCLCKAAGAYKATAGGDCNDQAAAISPQAGESCNGLDDDCDGLTDEAGASGCKTYFLDADQDAYGDAALQKCLCKPEAPYGATKIGDCDDGNETVNPGAAEVCNQVDDDCDAAVDEKGASGCAKYYLDLDKDGFGNPVHQQCTCTAEGDYTATKAGDCNDANAKVNPQAGETCNNFDDDCDGSLDEEGASGCAIYYRDLDADGYGVASDLKCLCAATGSYTAAVAGDCGDNNASIKPSAKETCNGLDDDCDGAADEDGAQGCVQYFSDSDADGFGDSGDMRCLCQTQGDYTATAGGDCNDLNASQNPQMQEKCDDLDNNCALGVDEACDKDDDGWCTSAMQVTGKPLVCPNGGSDCNDNNELIFPQASEKCDDVDNNCKLGTDEGCDDDGDKYCDGAMSTPAKPAVCPQGGNDCADNNKNVHPGLAETCDNQDNECNGIVDDGCDDDNDGWCDLAMDVVGTPATCLNGKNDCDDKAAGIHPDAAEMCNGKDDDCDAQVDEGAPACSDFFKDGDADGFGLGSDKKCLCAASGAYTANVGGDCNDMDPTVRPGATESCNGKDDDCDGVTDKEGAVGCTTFYKDQDDDGYGVGGDSKCLCAASGAYRATAKGDCNDANQSIKPSATEICNQVDDDCDALTDEPGAANCSKYYKDADADGFGVSADSQCLCAASGAYSALSANDCNDAAATINPNAKETCNGIDDNCNGQADEGAPACTTYYKDADGDGYGVTGNTQCTCGPSGQYTATQGNDCNDNGNLVNPGAPETCNGQDDNCNGQADEPGAQGCTTYYKDADGDGYGLQADSSCRCGPSAPYTATLTGDCNDQNANVNPGAKEVCNALDDDCDGSSNEENSPGCTTYYRDNDGDGYGASADFRCYCAVVGTYTASVGGDCNDNSAGIHPTAAELCDGLDNDCDGQVDEGATGQCTVYYRDADNDGFGLGSDSQCLCAPGGNYTTKIAGDCNDNSAAVNPAAAEFCNVVDDDCDGQVNEEGALGCTWFYKDADGDKYGDQAASKCLCAAAPPYAVSIGGDCNDGAAAINPAADDVCDGKDNNCDDLVDKGCDDDGDDWCQAGMTVVGSPAVCPLGSGDCNDENAAVRPNAAEKCNLVDDNCNGQADEGTDQQLCGAIPHATAKCQAGVCEIASCNSGWYDINGTPGDGCECGEDTWEASADTCTDAKDFGTLEDTGKIAAVTGNLLTGTDVDYVVFKGKDNPDDTCDALKVSVKLTSNPDGQFVVDVNRGSCSAADTICTATDHFSWFTNFTSADAGECPCHVLPPDSGADLSPAPAGHVCVDQTAYYYVRIYRKVGKPVTCDSYSIELSNAAD